MKLRVTGGLALCYFNQDGHNIIDVIYLHHLLQTPIMELFLEDGLKDEQAVGNVSLQLFLTDHQEQVLQKVREVDVEVQLHDFPDPAQQELPHLEIHRLHLQL